MNKLLVLTPNAGEYVTHLRRQDLADLEIFPAASFEEGRQLVADSNIILGKPMMVAELLSEAGRLVWVQSTFAGIESLCATGLRRDYLLTGVKGIFGPLMSEYVFAYILALERHLFEIRQSQIDNVWSDIPYRSLGGLTMGICGVGSIGQHIARTATHFGMRVLGFRRLPGDVENVEKVYTPPALHDFLKELDYFVVTLPHTSETKRLVNIDALQKMKPSAVLINVGRGAVIVESDLVRALRDGTIRGAILDVFDHEPLPRQSPLWDMSNVIVTPHNSAFSFPEDVVEIFCDNYRRFRENHPLKYLVDFGRGY